MGAATARAAMNAEQTTYFIQLIITDGEITDMDETIRALVDASPLPLSFIIVGVGDANFSNMNELDADDGPLVDNRGRRSVRDTVQFVPFRNYASQESGRLAKDVLHEVPQQLVQYMTSKGIKTPPPLPS